MGIVIGVIGLALTLGLAWRTERLTRGLDRVPVHWGIDFRPDAFGPRWVVVALIPGLHVATLALLAILALLHLPTHGNAMVGHLIVGLAFAFSQGLVFVLVRRWLRSGD